MRPLPTAPGGVSRGLQTCEQRRNDEEHGGYGALPGRAPDIVFSVHERECAEPYGHGQCNVCIMDVISFPCWIRSIDLWCGSQYVDLLSGKTLRVVDAMAGS